MPITEFSTPPRLAVGSHPRSRTYACGMNVISWENGDNPISDTPSCSPFPLARMVQFVNDRYCTHTTMEIDPDTTGLVKVLCSPCSVKVLRLAHRTVDAPKLDMRQGWAWTAELLKRSLSDGIQEMDLRTMRDAITIATAHAEGRTPPMPSCPPVRLAAAPMTSLAASIVHDVRATVRRLPSLVTPKPAWSQPHNGGFQPFATLDDFATVAEALYEKAAKHFAAPTGDVPECAGVTYVSGCADRSMTGKLLGRAHEAINLWIDIAVPEAAQARERVAA
ncbi:hypothetical protein [Amycolatopsis sp. NPDC004079]|uniref:hypothetical protein n=1 Tax=Amycolatopsis sp. NPDC004079 TaxID=3154549 RepID=UPI0033B35333